MPANKIVCPDCGAVLKPAKPVPDGKRVVCPKCKKTFVTPGAVEEDRPAKPAAKKKEAAGKQPAAKAPAGKAPAGKKPAAPPPPPPPEHEEDEGGGTYGVIKNDEEDEENKPDITYAPDMSIRDLRGPAQAAIIRPSNGLMVAGAIAVLMSILIIAWMMWPFIFADHVIDHADFLPVYYDLKAREVSTRSSIDMDSLNPEERQAVERAQGKDPKAALQEYYKKKAGETPPKERKDLSEDLLKALDKATAAEVQFRSLVAGYYFFIIIYNAFMIIGAVKMQNVESYGWSMAAAIMGILPFSFWLVSLPYGIWGVVALRDEKVIAGYYYKPK